MDSLIPDQSPTHSKAGDLPASPVRMAVVCLFSLMSSLGMTTLLGRATDQIWIGHLETVTEVISAPIDSKILSFEVQPGQEVRAGQLIIQLDSAALDQKIEDQSDKIEQLELELKQLEAKANVELSWRLKEIDDDIYGNKLKSADLLREKYLADFTDVAWSNVLSKHSPIQTAAATGLQPLVHSLSTPDEVRIQAMLEQEAAHNASEVYTAQVELLEKRLEELKSIRSSLDEQVRNAHGLPLIRHRLESATRELERLESLRDQSKILAPTYGTVGVFRLDAGAEINKGEPLFEILDRAQQYVTVLVRSRDLPSFQLGGQVNLNFPGEARRKGLISEIPPQITEVRENGESFSQIRITPVSSPWPELPFGSNVEVTLAKE